MSETKEEALCNNAQNHRQQLLNHQQELERDLEAGSCADEDDEEEENTDEGGEGEEGEAGEEGGTPDSKPKTIIPPLYNVEPGCTALGCYSAIATFIVMSIGIVALLMYSSPPNVAAENLVFDGDQMTTLPAFTTQPDSSPQ